MDRYTKGVLTVIAVALSVIAFRLGGTATATAQSASCGESSTRACYVIATNKFDDDLTVRISNFPSTVRIDNWPSSLR
jgi:hypothetical protein